MISRNAIHVIGWYGMKAQWNNRIGYFIFTLLVCSCMFAHSIQAEEIDVDIMVHPKSILLDAGESFSLDVICTPSQPIKSYELCFSFDPSLLQVNSISEGTILDEYDTYFSSGSIDNENGQVTNIFNLIIGSGNTSNPGSLISIEATALQTLGISPIHLYNVGVTDELSYLPTILHDGSICIEQNISISNPTPADGSMKISIGISHLSIDIVHKLGGEFDYRIVTSPDIGQVEDSNIGEATLVCSISELSYDTYYSWLVAVKDVGSGEWTNHTYTFRTESQPEDGNGGGGGGGAPYIPPPIDLNQAPLKPLKPSGPFYIEPGVDFTYSSSTYDPDGDQIRYRFDWGDGNISDWTGFLNGNVSISWTYQWNQVSNFTIRAQAQDETGENSSWSEGLLVICSFVEDENTTDIPPVANFSSSENSSFNNSVSFNASESFDSDGTIVSYLWDFGDGTTASGIFVDHVYGMAGTYSVSLLVIDDQGNNYSKTMQITVAGSLGTGEEEERGGMSFWPWVAWIGIIGALVILFIIYRNHIRVLIPKEHLNQVLNVLKESIGGVGRIFSDGTRSLHQYLKNGLKYGSEIRKEVYFYQDGAQANSSLDANSYEKDPWEPTTADILSQEVYERVEEVPSLFGGGVSLNEKYEIIDGISIDSNKLNNMSGDKMYELRLKIDRLIDKHNN